MSNVLIGEGAERDYAESLLWYAERSQLAAEGFDAEFSRALELIALHPGRYPYCDDRHQFFLLKRYPFQIIYSQTLDCRQLIVAVAHTSRNPGYWSNR